MNIELLWTILLLRFVGYGFLFLALVDMADAIIPPSFMNPAWEFQTIGIFAERAAIPLLALVMIFAWGEARRFPWEGNLLKLLSWLALLLGILHLLMVPLGIFDTVRLDRQNQQQIKVQVEQRMTQIQQLQGAVDNAKTPAELQPFLRGFGIENPAPDFGGAKEQVSAQIAGGTQNVKAQTKALQDSRRLQLIKNSVKWNLGVLVAGVLFLMIWQFSRSWTRFSLRRRRA